MTKRLCCKKFHNTASKKAAAHLCNLIAVHSVKINYFPMTKTGKTKKSPKSVDIGGVKSRGDLLFFIPFTHPRQKHQSKGPNRPVGRNHQSAAAGSAGGGTGPKADEKAGGAG